MKANKSRTKPYLSFDKNIKRPASHPHLSNIFLAFFIFSVGSTAEEFSWKKLDLEKPERLSGTFTQLQTFPGINTKLKSSGRFFFSTDHGFIWITDAPVQQATLYQQKDIYQFNLIQNEFKASKSKIKNQKKIGSIINALISQEWQVLDKYFLTEVTQNERSKTLILTPKNKHARKNLKNLNIHINKAIEGYTLNFVNGEIIDVALVSSDFDNLFFNDECTYDEDFLQHICQHSIKPVREK